MNVYQTFSLSLQIVDMSLQSNGLYIVTRERGYLGFYPLLGKEHNVEEKTGAREKQIKQPKLNEKLVISGNEVFFFTQLEKQKILTKL